MKLKSMINKARIFRSTVINNQNQFFRDKIMELQEGIKNYNHRNQS